MKKLKGKILFISCLFLLSHNIFMAQEELPVDQGFFQDFQNIATSKERFNFFFNTSNRYNQNSGFDWLDKTNVYLNNAKQSKDTVAIKYYKAIQSQIYHDLGDYDKSLAIAKEIYAIKDSWGLESQAILLDLMDRTYAQLELYNQQIEIRKEKKELGITANVSFYDIYANLGLHRKAMQDYIQQEKRNIDDNDYYAQAVYNNNIGTYLRLDKSYPTALGSYKKAISFANIYLNDVTKIKTEKQRTDTEILKSIIDGHIGKCYTQLKRYEEAIPHLEKSIRSIKELSKDLFLSDHIENQLTVAECYLQLGDLEKTTDYLSSDLNPRKAENILKKNRLLASYYNIIGEYKSESEFLKKNIRIRDSIQAYKTKILDEQRSTLIAEDKAYTKSKIEEQNQALEDSRNKMVEQEDRIQFVFILLVFALLGLAGVVYAYVSSIKSQRLIASQKHIIESALVEKDSLLKEIHHRVKNNLQMVSSLLSLQTKNTRSKAAIEALEEGKSRVKAMALIHQKLYQNDDLSVIEMQGYIESLINSVQSVFKKGGHNISITIDAEGVELDIDRAIPFGLILNELVSNSFKYAFPEKDDDGKIYIHLRKIADQEGFFEYTDNGIGLPDDTEERTKSSMGIRLMNRLVNQLQSTLNIDKTADGVRFWFNFK